MYLNAIVSTINCKENLKNPYSFSIFVRKILKILTLLMEKSIHNRIKAVIDSKSPGTLLFPDEFLELGTAESVHTTLSRLTKEGQIARLGKGVYWKPKTDPVVGSVMPSLTDIAQAIAGKEQVIIRPTGAYALNILGLSTQVPTKVVYLTNGSPRSIKIGRATIRFKATTPKKLAVKNEKLFLVIQALEELGPERVTDKVLGQIKDILSFEPVHEIRESAKLAQQFVARALYKIADTLAYHD